MGQPTGQAKPLAGYRMWGVECGLCGSRMSVLWLFSDHLETWHENTESRCVSVYYRRPPLALPVAIERPPDARKKPRKYIHCRHCGVRFAQFTAEGEPATDLCKSCRHQQELFTDAEITNAQDRVPSEQT